MLKVDGVTAISLEKSVDLDIQAIEIVMDRFGVIKRN
jgi:hypothetical protein